MRLLVGVWAGSTSRKVLLLNGPQLLVTLRRRDDGGTKLLSKDLAPVAEEAFVVHAKFDTEDGATIMAVAQDTIDASKARLTAGEGAARWSNPGI